MGESTNGLPAGACYNGLFRDEGRLGARHDFSADKPVCAAVWAPVSQEPRKTGAQPCSGTVITIETRIHDPALFQQLEQFGALFCRLERLLFKALYVQGEKLVDAKRRFIAEHRITARHFNSVHKQLESKVESGIEIRKSQLATLSRQIEKVSRAILRKKSPFVVHQKKRRLQRLESRKSRIERQLERPIPSICFGSRAMFQKQFHLKENDYSCHGDWRKAWHAKRDSSFFLLGSSDESCGNQSCRHGPEGVYLRLPDALGGATITIPLRFPYREADLLAALSTKKQRLTRGPRKGTVVERGSAISYRFLRRGEHWYLQAMFEVAKAPITTNRQRGCLGVDLNPWGLAVARIDPSGNPADSFDLPWQVKGRNKNQIKAAIGDKVRDAVLYAKSRGIPIAIEKLDFTAKKAEDRGAGINRMLSAFAYSAFAHIIRGRCAREGVELIERSATFTSVIGRGKFAQGYGLSVHRAAACVIARRALNFGEQLRTRSARTTLALPARNRARHVWHNWSLWAKARQPRRTRLTKAKASPGSKPANVRRTSSDPPPPNAPRRAGGAMPRIDAALAVSGATPEVNGRNRCSGGLDRQLSSATNLDC